MQVQVRGMRARESQGEKKDGGFWAGVWERRRRKTRLKGSQGGKETQTRSPINDGIRYRGRMNGECRRCVGEEERRR